MAGLTDNAVPEFEPVRLLYEAEARWRVPATIRSYTVEGVTTIDLADV